MLTVMLGLLVATAIQAFLAGSLPAAGRSIGLEPLQTGAVLTGGALFGVVCGPLWGFASERWGRRRILLIALSLGALGPLTMALTFGWLVSALSVSATLALLVLGRTFQAGFGSAVYPVAQAYTADTTRATGRVGGMGILAAASSTGTIAGSALIWVVSDVGVQWAFGVLAAASLVTFLFSIVGLREPVRPSPDDAGMSIIPFGLVAPLFLITLATMTAFTLIQPTIGLRLMDHFGLAPAHALAQAGILLVSASVATVLAQALVVVRLRWPVGRLIAVGALLATAAAALMTVTESMIGIWIGFLAGGFALGLILPANLAAMSLVTGPLAQGKVAGINAGAYRLGLALGPLAGTAIYGFSGTGPFWLAGILFAVVAGTVAVLTVRWGADWSKQRSGKAP
jgi:MFS family permease